MNALDPQEESSRAESLGRKHADLQTHDKVAGLSRLMPILQMRKSEIQKSWDLTKVRQIEPGPDFQAMGFPPATLPQRSGFFE